jgi:hypothetical protein
MIPRGAIRVRIQNRFAVDEEAVVVIAVVQGEPEHPDPVSMAFHRMRLGIPVIKITHQMDFSGFGRQASKDNDWGIGRWIFWRTD